MDLQVLKGRPLPEGVPPAAVRPHQWLACTNLGFRPMFRVQGSGVRVQGLGFRVQGLGFRVQGLGFRVQSSGFRVLGFRRLRDLIGLSTLDP